MQSIDNRDAWHALLARLPQAHLLQSWDWGEIKSRYGWTARRFAWFDGEMPVAAAQVLRREQRVGPLPGPAMLYAPKGPVFDWADGALRDRVLDDLQAFARRDGALFVKIDPDVMLGTGEPDIGNDDPVGAAWQQALNARGWHYSNDQVQFRNTVVIDLAPDEDTLLASFKQKTRYNIRLAARKGVTVRQATVDDLAVLAEIYRATAERDDFIIRGVDYYLDAWSALLNAGYAQPLVAEVAGEAVAGLVATAFGERAFYMYGMSSEAHRNLMPTYALQWAAMQWARAAGFRWYDMWGAPERFGEGDPLRGVWRFKSGFNGTVWRTLGAWDYPASRTGYWLFQQARPHMLRVMRRVIGRN